MLQGRYRDVVTGAGGGRVRAAPWRPNLVLDGAFTLVAALLKRDPDARGILYWAVGEGDPAWDAAPPATEPGTERLVAEVMRLEVPPEAIVYVDERGAESRDPSPGLEIRLTFEAPRDGLTLREFGVFGGAAAARPGSGTMINHVIHRRIDLEPGQRLTRELRLSLGRGADRRWADVPPHWLGDAAARTVQGVGPAFAGFLGTAGVATVDALARSDPDAAVPGITAVTLLELRSRARLALRTAAEVHPPVGLHALTVAQVLTTRPADLAASTGVAAFDVVRLREQLCTLELALDHRFLGGQGIGTLAGAGP